MWSNTSNLSSVPRSQYRQETNKKGLTASLKSRLSCNPMHAFLNSVGLASEETCVGLSCWFSLERSVGRMTRCKGVQVSCVLKKWSSAGLGHNRIKSGSLPPTKINQMPSRSPQAEQESNRKEAPAFASPGEIFSDTAWYAAGLLKQS